MQALRIVIADEELREELRKINSNSRLSEMFLSLARDLDVMEPKSPEEVKHDMPSRLIQLFGLLQPWLQHAAFWTNLMADCVFPGGEDTRSLHSVAVYGQTLKQVYLFVPNTTAPAKPRLLLPLAHCLSTAFCIKHDGCSQSEDRILRCAQSTSSTYTNSPYLQVYKSHLTEGRAPSGPAVDSARQNLASTFVNAFVNAGFGQDKLMTIIPETDSLENVHWIFKNKASQLLT